MIPRIITTIFLATLVFSCGNKENKQVEITTEEKVEQVKNSVQWPYGVKYEIFVQSFYDSNGDGIGDINGMTSKLDYIQELGVNGIWLMPISPSPTYHKYDVTDYRDIHPDYGTLDEFKNFVSEAHKRGIKIIIDLVVNHSSSSHPWFIQASSSIDNPYRDYYVWEKREDILEDIAKKEVTMDSDNITQWHENEKDDSEELFYGFFHGGMPDLNFDNQKVRAEIFEIGKFWLKEVDVDGFRLDAAKHIYPDDRAEDNHAWWEEFRSEMQKIKPNVYLVGEVWDDASIVGPFLSGLPSLFNFDLAFSILASVKEEKSVSVEIVGPSWEPKEGFTLESGFIQTNKAYKKVNPNFTDAIFLSNHDQNRVQSFLKGDKNKAKLAASILLTLPGIPYIYYGEEIGMLGMKPDEHIREPIIWSNSSKEGKASWIKATYSTNEQISGAEEQLSDANSILDRYKELIKLRNSSDILSLGGIEYLELGDEKLVSFKRVYEGEALSVIHNLSGEVIEVQQAIEASDIFYSSNAQNTFTNGKVIIQPYSSMVLK